MVRSRWWGDAVGAAVILRRPLIPGVNDADAEIVGIAAPFPPKTYGADLVARLSALTVKPSV
ncbi:MAG: hypothetical protein ACOX9C_08430 [Kiritimatiellia bacterium]